MRALPYGDEDIFIPLIQIKIVIYKKV